MLKIEVLKCNASCSVNNLQKVNIRSAVFDQTSSTDHAYKITAKKNNI